MTKTTAVIVRAAGLSAGYGHKLIWQNADFTIREGEFVGVLGPNGAGKTTLFRLLLGLSKPLAGRLEVFGSQPHRGNPRIGYVPQRHPVDSELRLEALELVRLGISGNRWGAALPAQAAAERQQALEALGAVQAEALAGRSLGELSGGELQRVFLAQALAGRPDLLLLDEPLANLDIRREVELVQLVAEVARTQSVAVLLIAHDINPLLPVVDRLIYAVNGRIATGTPKQIITTEELSKLYDAPVEVLRDSRGRVAVLGTEEAVHHD
jgi:zinc/manganese transport system ATP-binding protein